MADNDEGGEAGVKLTGSEADGLDWSVRITEVQRFADDPEDDDLEDLFAVTFAECGPDANAAVEIIVADAADIEVVAMGLETLQGALLAWADLIRRPKAELRAILAEGETGITPPPRRKPRPPREHPGEKKREGVAPIGTGDESVVARQSERIDRALHRVGVRLNPAIVDVGRQARPAGRRVADRHGERALLAAEGQFVAQEALKRSQQRPAPLVARQAA